MSLLPRPIPSARIDAALDDFDRHGLAVVPEVLDADELADVRARLLAAAARSEAAGVPTRGYAFDPDDRNQRVFHLFNLDPVFVDLIEHPVALAFVHHALGDEFLISNFSANITAPGSGAMQLHADQGYVPPPWPERPLACNVAWVLDDFTPENGGTRYVADSHRLGHGPDPARDYATEMIAAPAGAVMVMDGRLWHQSGANHSKDSQRAALFGYYVARWLRPQVNWNVVLDPAVVATLSPAFLDRLGYYTGNVESLIPAGTRAAIPVPDEIVAGGRRDFPLGTDEDGTGAAG
ncbi:MAG: phytanoyl-CoA dioxygenase family protein [Gammaproteobacteria bacterium]